MSDTITRPIMGFIPFTPVSFSGDEAWIAYARLALFGAIAAMTWGKQKNISYIAIGSAALSLTTSLSATAWNKTQGLPGQVQAQPLPSTATIPE